MTDVRPRARMAASIARICETEKRHIGRPVSVGVGKKVTIYLPNKSLDLLDRISRNWSGSRSDIIQEAIARYAADLDAVIYEGSDSVTNDSYINPCVGCDDYDVVHDSCYSKGGCGSIKGDHDNG